MTDANDRAARLVDAINVAGRYKALTDAEFDALTATHLGGSPVEHTNDQHLAVYFTPHAIRDSYELNDDDDPEKMWVAAASDDELRQVGDACVNSETIWRTFHEVIGQAVRLRMKAY